MQGKKGTANILLTMRIEENLSDEEPEGKNNIMLLEDEESSEKVDEEDHKFPIFEIFPNT